MVAPLEGNGRVTEPRRADGAARSMILQKQKREDAVPRGTGYSRELRQPAGQKT